MSREIDRSAKGARLWFAGLAIWMTCLLGGPSGNASASTVDLRPNSSATPSMSGWTFIPWSVNGAPSAWEAVNDQVLPGELPSHADYLRATGTFAIENGVELGIQSIPLHENSISKATIWTYVSQKGPVFAEARSGGVRIAETLFEAVGWHHLPVPLSGSQSQLNGLKIGLYGAKSGAAAADIEATFLQLSLNKPPPKIYWGAWMSGEVAKLEKDEFGNPFPVRGDAPWDSETWDLFEEHAGKHASIVHFGQPSPWFQEFHPGPLELVRKSGAIPLMSMGSYGAELSELEEGGAKEGALREWAEAVAEYGKPFFFRWNWEMNLDSAPQYPLGSGSSQ